jgi:hypothetical protein
MTKKPDAPLIAMRVEQGRLVPASAFDLELLNDWHEGAVVNVEVTRTAVRPAEKSYFAALSKLIKLADTPWTNTQEAHDALKKATGFVTFGKNYKPLERRISSFDDAELDEFIELFYGIASERFGIDAETLSKEASESSGPRPPAGADDAPSPSLIPAGAGVPEIPSEIIEPMEGGVPEAGGGDETTPRSPSSADGLSTEDWDWLKTTARMLVAAVGDDPDILNRQRNAIKLHHTHPDISSGARDKAADIYHHCLAACKGEQTLDLNWIADIANCKLSDLRPEAR